jgi:hypothetical protein
MKKKGALSTLSLSLLIHASAVGMLILFPPTKSVIFFRSTPVPLTANHPLKEQLLDEIDIVTLTKKPSQDQCFDLLNDQIGTVSHELPFMPSLDLSLELREHINTDFPIDSTLSFQLPPYLDNRSMGYEHYLSPPPKLSVPELFDEPPLTTQSYEPLIKPLTVQDHNTPQLSQLDEFDFNGLIIPMPEMLDTAIYTYKDSAHDEFFKMELRLKDHQLFDERPEEFIFAIDLTQKNNRNHLTTFKTAIVNAIKLLKKDDLVNIVIINKDSQPLFIKSSPPAKFNENDLDTLLTHPYRSKAGMKDLTKHLKILFEASEESLLHTHFILFTQEPQNSQDQLLKLARFAHSKFSFYPIIFNEHPQNKETFKTLATNLGGHLVSPPTKASFNRKISNLILDIKKTRLNNVCIKVDSENGPIDISLSEKAKQLSLKKPLKIFGKLNGARHLKLQVVGSHGDDLFEMKKNLSIHEAKKGSCLIKKELNTSN